MDEILPEVYKSGKGLWTKALAPGSVYGEELKDGYRSWNPHRSKLAAAILKGLKSFPFRKTSNILYLGASTGTTVSHLSDIVSNGHIYALEFSETAMRKLLELSGKRKNVTPLLQDARRPEDYRYLVGDVDVIYQDVAQPDQSEILKKNAGIFLGAGGRAVMCLKARSIDAVKRPADVFKRERERLSEDFEILQEVKLEPYDKDHRFLLLKLRGS